MKITTDDNKHVTTAIESSTQGQTELRGRDTLSAHEMVSYEIRRYACRNREMYMYTTCVLRGNINPGSKVHNGSSLPAALGMALGMAGDDAGDGWGREGMAGMAHL